MIRKLAFFCLSLAAASSTLAQTALHYRDGDVVDPVEVAQILATQTPRAVKTRSLRLLDQATPSIEAPLPRALSIPVHFALNSAEIVPSARRQLDALGEGIKLLPESQKVIVEGHTDATGTDVFNLLLSQRRAAAVKGYLVAVHGIDPVRLKDIGFGEYRPIEGVDPFAAEQRRVQFRGE